jgi:membrane associated rhomboid family serine protease
MTIPLSLCMMKILYYATSGPGSILFSHPRRVINNWLIGLYNTSPFFAAVWPYVPHPTTSPLLSADNLWFAVLAAIIACGYLMRDSGAHLRQRIAAVRQRAEEKRWEQSLTGNLPRPDVLTLQIDLTTRDQWYKRPFGIVLLMVIGGIIPLLLVEWFSLFG